MNKYLRFLILAPASFTLLAIWFAWTAYRAAPQIAGENLRGAGLSCAAAIEQLAIADPTFVLLGGYHSADLAYFALLDNNNVIRFHGNRQLIGQTAAGYGQLPPDTPMAESREQLGTGEEVYLLRSRVHLPTGEYLLVLALHTYKADQVIRRANTGIAVIAAMTLVLWGLTGVLLLMMRREEQRRKEMARREELARLGEMAAVLAHEIRNPLAGIKGYAQLVESAGELSQARLFADKVVEQSVRMEALVNDLLLFARDDRGERTPVDLALLVQDCAMMIRMESCSDRITVHHEPHQPLTALVDPDKITQLLLNLLKNGMQAMPDGGELKVTLAQQGGDAVITISDSGIGIPAEHMTTIFEPFWTSKASGTGLGLALCRKIALEHGGSIQVVSSVGTGSTFTVTLPLGG